MNLFIMRHGDALPVGGAIREDTLRPLSPQGHTQVRQVATVFKEKSLPLKAIVSSPLIRATETAAIMAEVLQITQVVQSPALSPSASPRGLNAILSAHSGEGLLWVGHHPDVTLWIAFFTGLDPSVCPLFGTASMAALHFPDSSAKAEFLWFQP